jgi:putative salt-induced outer membrane protein
MRAPSFLLLTALLAGSASADNATAPGWHSAAELGAITTSGNTAGTSVTGKLDIRHELEEWSNQYIFSGFYKEDEVTKDGERVKTRAAQRFLVSGKAAYKLMEPGQKLFVLATHAEDRFGPYTTYSSMAIGRGTRLYESHGDSVDVELGPGYFVGTRAAGADESGVTVRGAAAVRWQLSPSAVFSQSASIERGTTNVHSSAEAAVSTKINSTMQMKAAFAARNDTNVPEGKKNTDSQTSLTLVYSF